MKKKIARASKFKRKELDQIDYIPLILEMRAEFNWPTTVGYISNLKKINKYDLSVLYENHKEMKNQITKVF